MPLLQVLSALTHSYTVEGHPPSLATVSQCDLPGKIASKSLLTSSTARAGPVGPTLPFRVIFLGRSVDLTIGSMCRIIFRGRFML